jgi:hypothetical protein
MLTHTLADNEDLVTAVAESVGAILVEIFAVKFSRVRNTKSDRNWSRSTDELGVGFANEKTRKHCAHCVG